MLFTDGKDRFYESLMRGVPNFQKRGSGERHMAFRYRFRDLDCRYCTEYKVCGHEFCPYILDNLEDLSRDVEFIGAVLAAETCDTPQRQTLLYLKERRL